MTTNYFATTLPERCKCGHERKEHGRVKIGKHPVQYVGECLYWDDEEINCDCKKFVSQGLGEKNGK